MVKYNNTLVFVIPFLDENDYYIKTTVFVLTLNIYIFFNILLMSTSSSLHLYKDKDKDLEDNRGKYRFINIFIYPILFYIFSSFFKKCTSIREFRYDKINEAVDIENNNNLTEGERILQLHELKTEASKLIKFKEGIFPIICFVICLTFLIFNCCLVTFFCSVYNNSIDCLFLNIFVSFVGALFITLFIFFLSSLLRYISLHKINNCANIVYDISRCLNPTYVMYRINIFSWIFKCRKKLKQN